MILTYFLSTLFLILGAIELLNLLPQFGFSFEPIRNAILWVLGLAILIASTISPKPKLVMQKALGILSLLIFLLDAAALFNITLRGFSLLPAASTPQVLHLALFGLTSSALLVISFLPKQKNPVVMGN